MADASGASLGEVFHERSLGVGRDAEGANNASAAHLEFHAHLWRQSIAAAEGDRTVGAAIVKAH
jgi:hypothetical protein